MSNLSKYYDSFMRQFNLLYKIKELAINNYLSIEELNIKSDKSVQENRWKILVILSQFYNDKHHFNLNTEILLDRYIYRDFIEERDRNDKYTSSYPNEEIYYTPYTDSIKLGFYDSNYFTVLSTPDYLVECGEISDLFLLDVKEEVDVSFNFDIIMRELLAYGVDYKSNLYKTSLQHVIDNNYSFDSIMEIENINIKTNEKLKENDFKTIKKLRELNIINNNDKR